MRRRVPLVDGSGPPGPSEQRRAIDDPGVVHSGRQSHEGQRRPEDVGQIRVAFHQTLLERRPGVGTEPSRALPCRRLEGWSDSTHTETSSDPEPRSRRGERDNPADSRSQKLATGRLRPLRPATVGSRARHSGGGFVE
jgi:hypothetical protein